MNVNRRTRRSTAAIVLKTASACFAILAAAWLAGCERETPPEPAPKEPPAKPVVYTTFYPTTYFAERIAGEEAEVVCPCPPDADPAHWMPDDETLAAYQNADIIVINGADFEGWITKVTLPQDRIVDTTATLADDLITLKDKFVHSHGPGHTHTHGGIDGHTWLDPVSAKVQAGQIGEALARHFPHIQETFEAGFADLAADLDALHLRHETLAPAIREHFLLASHPAYNYLARRYGWRQKYFHLDPETMPDDETLAKIGAAAKEHQADIMLWESPPAPAIADRFRDELGLESILYSPCETLDPAARAAGESFLTVMNANLDRLEAAVAD